MQQTDLNSPPPPAPGLGRKIARRLRRWRHALRLRASVRHLHGPASRTPSGDEVTVVALVRDGGFYLAGFLAHYRRLGAAHFVFFDNGSADDTIERLRAEPDVSVLQSALPWGAFENDFRRIAAERFCRGGWCLFADMDELFDFEGSAALGLSGLARYLRREGHTALLAQMLEMFPEAPLSETARMPYANAIAAYRWCDLSYLRRLPYHSPGIGFSYFLQANTLADPEAEFLFGGVRGKVFGENCCLTKHPLVFLGDGVQASVHPHCSSHVRVADFTALIRHYKFTNDPFGRDQASVAASAISHGEDQLRSRRAAGDPDLSLWSPEAQEFTGIRQLQDQGFLRRSPRFSAYLAEQTP